MLLPVDSRQSSVNSSFVNDWFCIELRSLEFGLEFNRTLSLVLYYFIKFKCSVWKTGWRLPVTNQRGGSGPQRSAVNTTAAPDLITSRLSQVQFPQVTPVYSIISHNSEHSSCSFCDRRAAHSVTVHTRLSHLLRWWERQITSSRKTSRRRSNL